MKRVLIIRLNTAVAMVFMATAGLAQWSFKVDTTFRTSIVDRAVNSLLVLPDGRLFASGLIRYPGDFTERGSTILMPDGSRDLTFTGFFGGGRIIPWINYQFYAATSLPRRLLADGNIDQSFIGLNTGPYFQSLQGSDYHVYPDGSVLISGRHLLSDSIRGFEGVYNLIWFTNTGYLDTTRTHRQTNGTIWKFKELPDGKFLCSCGCSQYDGQPVSRVFRIHPDGALDTTFTSDITEGFLKTYFPLTDGRVLIGGNFQSNTMPGETLHLARLLPDGAFDPLFGNLQFQGNDAWWVPAGTSVFDIFQFTPDRFIVTGQFTSVNGELRGGICVIDSAGQLLPQFDESGGGLFISQNVTNLAILDVKWNPDSTAIYICGAYTGYNDGTTNDTLQRFVSRLLVTEDIAMGVNETAQAEFHIYPNPASNSVTLEVEELAPNTAIFLRDALGRELLQQKITQYRSTLQVQHLPNGIYIVEIRSANGWPHKQRLVVQH